MLMEAPICSCGKGKMILRQTTEPPTIGRWYFKCPVGNEHEGYFKWLDTPNGVESVLPGSSTKQQPVYSPTICPGCSSIFTNDENEDTNSCGRIPEVSTPVKELGNTQMSSTKPKLTEFNEYDRIVRLIPVLSSVFLVGAFIGLVLGFIIGKVC